MRWIFPRPGGRPAEFSAEASVFLLGCNVDDRAIELVVTDLAGEEHRLAALDGWRAMEVIRDWGLPIKAECGGAGCCGTCHVVVDEEWAARLPQPTDEELDMLDELPVIEPTSRLSCQFSSTRRSTACG